MTCPLRSDSPWLHEAHPLHCYTPHEHQHTTPRRRKRLEDDDEQPLRAVGGLHGDPRTRIASWCTLVIDRRARPPYAHASLPGLGRQMRMAGTSATQKERLMHRPYGLAVGCALLLLLAATTGARAQGAPQALLLLQFATIARGDVAGALAHKRELKVFSPVKPHATPSCHLPLMTAMWTRSLFQPGPHSGFLMASTPR